MTRLIAPKPVDRASVEKALDPNAWYDRVERANEAQNLASDVFAEMQHIMDTASEAGRDLLASERREYDKRQKVFDELTKIHAENWVDRRGLTAPTVRDVKPYAKDRPLAEGQSFTGFAASQGHMTRNAHGDEPTDLNLTRFLKGATTGDWQDAEAERSTFQNALSGTSGGAGGVLLPTQLATKIIDLARAQTRVLEAGAQIVPMTTRTLDVPRWVTDPSPTWRAENAAIGESDAVLDKVTLAAKSLAVVTRVSRELVEDTDIEDPLLASFAAGFALKLDAAALYGSGASNEPTGIKVNTGVAKTSLATNGATPTWANLVDAVGRLRDANEEPTAQILADRTLRSLAKAVDTTGQYIAPPSYLDGVDRLATSQVPITLTQGTNSDASDIFTGDFTQLLMGVRIDLRIDVLTERYMADNGQLGFVGWFRGDIAVARPKAFDVVTGARP